MNLKKCLAAGSWIALAMAAGAMASSDCPRQVRFSTTASITNALAQGDASEAQGTCDDEARYWPYGSDHWTLYQRLAGRSAPAAPTRPDFSGDWVLNAKASDDLQAKAKEVMQASRQTRGSVSGGMGRGGGRGRGGGMGGGRQGRGGAGGMGGGGGPSSSELSALLTPAQDLHITHQDPMLLIADENDQRQHLFTDFRGASVSASGGLQQRVAVAGWEGTLLVVETTMLGRKLTQRYQIDGGTGQLVVSTVAQLSEAQPVSYRLVYDPRKPEADGERTRQRIGAAQGETR